MTFSIEKEFEEEVINEICSKINQMVNLEKEMHSVLINLQQENSELIEEILSLVNRTESNSDAINMTDISSLMTCGWPENFFKYQILLKKHKIHKIDEMSKERNENEGTNQKHRTLNELNDNIKDLQEEREIQQKNLKDLEFELQQMKENSEKEKILLRQELLTQ